ncbi:type III-B CRISPR module-associated protein Cmr3 [Rapidithrix thailandica]|uniref:Type III-B CRISPR module-associated protein Cmr3 n=1 Tax=Rapidithrix thailandica TaxID=413964 RepID=A0AAW9RTL8_9BACT
MRIKIKALDTLFFRDGKPFSMGEETWADGIFPPPPSVFYGALRTLYFSENPDKIGLANTKEDPTKNLKIKGIYFYFNNALHFINPKDSVVNVDEEDEYHILNLKKQDFITSNSLPYQVVIPEENLVVEDVEGFIKQDSFRRYIEHGKNVFKVLPFSDYIKNEPKVGIGRNKQTNATSEGLLYRVGMQRLSYRDTALDVYETESASKHLYFVVDFEDLNIDTNNGFLKLGGEGKTVYFQTFGDALDVPQFIDTNSKIFKLYLLTPAIFQNGWLPSWIQLDKEKNEYCGEFEHAEDKEKIKVKLLTAFIGKPIGIGGFDMQKKEPKPLRKAIPTGSVYYFEVENEKDISRINQAFQLKSISDFCQNEGFGISIVSKPNLG